jgi:hypothetical protein
MGTRSPHLFKVIAENQGVQVVGSVGTEVAVFIGEGREIYKQ